MESYSLDFSKYLLKFTPICPIDAETRHLPLNLWFIAILFYHQMKKMSKGKPGTTGNLTFDKITESISTTDFRSR